MTEQATNAGVMLSLPMVIVAGIPITPDANAPIHANSPFMPTTRGPRTVISPSTVDIDTINNYIRANAFAAAYFGIL
jgi:hypothetical protein